MEDRWGLPPRPDVPAAHRRPRDPLVPLVVAMALALGAILSLGPLFGRDSSARVAGEPARSPTTPARTATAAADLVTLGLPYRSTSGRFEVIPPESGAVTERVAVGAIGSPDVEYHEVDFPSPQATSYLVAWADLHEDYYRTHLLGAILRDAQRELVSSNEAKLTRAKWVLVDGVSCRDLQFRGGGVVDAFTVVYRVCVSLGREYRASVVLEGGPGGLPPDAGEPFLDSFHALPP